MSGIVPRYMDEELLELRTRIERARLDEDSVTHAYFKKKELEEAMANVLEEPLDLSWEALARPSQRIPPGDWLVWLILAGRGFGKTRTGAETIRTWIRQNKCRLVALVAETEDEARRVMVEGESGFLTISSENERPTYVAGKGQLVWPSGAKAMIYTAENYDKLRGGQFDGAWVDELAKFRNAQKVWDQLMFGLRMGAHPQVVVTTTPRPIPLLETLMKDGKTHVTRGSTYENAANLSPLFTNYILKTYEGTRMGSQEIHGELLFDQPGALWKRDLIRYGLP